MIRVIFMTTILPILVTCSGEGNIRLLESEIAIAIETCTNDDSKVLRNPRKTRSENHQSPHIDSNLRQEVNQYGHERRDPKDMEELTQSDLNATNMEYPSIVQNGSEVVDDESDKSVSNRTRRNAMLAKQDSEQCLSQCIFANLQVVDSQGIPREAELWNVIQSSVTSQQSRAALRDQIRACFQELQSEAEDNGCSYSNKLERCLMLRFSDRQTKETKESKKPESR